MIPYDKNVGDNMKRIGEVFSDYKTNSNIADAEITKMNLIKKINHFPREG